jgi:hypothetical protein
MKMQKTSSGGGYHVWHGEQGNGEQANRFGIHALPKHVAFRSQWRNRIFIPTAKNSPVKNTMVLWPAAFTHAHRGNPVYGDNHKYIVTGWFYHE